MMTDDNSGHLSQLLFAMEYVANEQVLHSEVGALKLSEATIKRLMELGSLSEKEGVEIRSREFDVHVEGEKAGPPCVTISQDNGVTVVGFEYLAYVGADGEATMRSADRIPLDLLASTFRTLEAEKPLERSVIVAPSGESTLYMLVTAPQAMIANMSHFDLVFELGDEMDGDSHNKKEVAREFFAENLTLNDPSDNHDIDDVWVFFA